VPEVGQNCRNGLRVVEVAGAQGSVPFLTKKGGLLPLPVSCSKEPQPNEPPCREQLKGDHLPPVSWNVGKGATYKWARRAMQSRGLQKHPNVSVAPPPAVLGALPDSAVTAASKEKV